MVTLPTTRRLPPAEPATSARAPVRDALQRIDLLGPDVYARVALGHGRRPVDCRRHLDHCVSAGISKLNNSPSAPSAAHRQ